MTYVGDEMGSCVCMNSNGDVLYHYGKDHYYEFHLSNSNIYRVGIYGNFSKYRIKKGFLYKGLFKKLGRITEIKDVGWF